jgi:hypothetical protein
MLRVVAADDRLFNPVRQVPLPIGSLDMSLISDDSPDFLQDRGEAGEVDQVVRGSDHHREGTLEQYWAPQGWETTLCRTRRRWLLTGRTGLAHLCPFVPS